MPRPPADVAWFIVLAELDKNASQLDAYLAENCRQAVNDQLTCCRASLK